MLQVTIKLQAPGSEHLNAVLSQGPLCLDDHLSPAFVPARHAGSSWPTRREQLLSVGDVGCVISDLG